MDLGISSCADSTAAAGRQGREGAGMTAAELRQCIESDGYVIVPDVLDPSFIARAKRELADAIELEAVRYGQPASRDYGMVMVCAQYGGAFLDLFDNDTL